MAKKYEFKPDKPRSGFLSKLFLTQKQRRALLKWSLYALVLVVTSLFQDVMFSRLNFYGGTTELVPCAIFLVCIMEGVETGGVFALVASLGGEHLIALHFQHGLQRGDDAGLVLHDQYLVFIVAHDHPPVPV